MTLVRKRFADHFGSLESFDWAVTREDALEALQHFITNYLSQFGDYQDAMKAGQDFPVPFGLVAIYEHRAAESPRGMRGHTHYRGWAQLSAVEGFVRQILGWREYVRGVYWIDARLCTD